MPIYEFYCQDCHTLFNFFSARIDTESCPQCPRCGRENLPRRPSRFATLKHRDEDTGDPLDAMDDSRLEGAMDTLMSEMESLENQDDPRVMGQMMRRFSQLTGLQMDDQIEDFVTRLEAGEDPDHLEQEMEQTFGDDQSLDQLFKLKKAFTSYRSRRPKVDDELYYL